MMMMTMMMMVLSLMLLLRGCLGHLALQDLLPLLVHVALHAGEGVVPHLAQVGLQVLLLGVVCITTESNASPPEGSGTEPSAAHLIRIQTCIPASQRARITVLLLILELQPGATSRPV